MPDLTDEQIRRRVAGIAGLTLAQMEEFRREVGNPTEFLPRYESSADAILPVLRAWCARHFARAVFTFIVKEWGCTLSSWDGQREFGCCTANHLSRAIALALIAGDDAVKGGAK